MSKKKKPIEVPVEATVAELLETVRELADRVAHLEASLEEQEAAGIPEEVVVAISAAVAAYLGHRAKVTQLHYRTGAAYAQQARASRALQNPSAEILQFHASVQVEMSAVTDAPSVPAFFLSPTFRRA